MSSTLTAEGPVAGDPAVAPEASPADAAPDAAADVQASAPRTLTPHCALGRVVLLLNPLSGSVGGGAGADAREIFDDYEIEAEVRPLDGDFDATITAAFESGPDAIFVLAGDGTARAVAARSGPDGPPIAPLPGGTMNMLPKALYGTTDWKEALRKALEEGEPRFVSGGRVNADDPFFCAAIFGSPALWAPAREAVRTGQLKLAWAYARRALRRAFTGRIRYSLDGARRKRTEALALISPMISKAMEEPTGLEAAAMDPADTTEAFRMAVHALFTDWRQDPSVETRPARRIAIGARSRIPAVIDGEPTLLDREAMVTFLPRAFRALTPRPPAAKDSV